MVEKIRLGILGATGRVGRTAMDLVARHLEGKFEITYVAASSRSAGQKYIDAIRDKEVVGLVPETAKELIVFDSNNPESAVGKCDLILSAIEISSEGKDGKKLSSEEKNERIRALENHYASLDLAVVSCNAAHRWTRDVPIIIPEINYKHLEMIETQRTLRGWKNGSLIVKPNCSEQSFMLPVYALSRAGYSVSDMIVVTQQGLSGAGDGGDPVVSENGSRKPYISGEEEKTRREPLKILGKYVSGVICDSTYPRISSICTRDNVANGHSANIFLKFLDKVPSLDEIVDIWNGFQPDYSRAGLRLAPEKPIIYRNEPDRPRPDADLMTGKGMTVTMGRLDKSFSPLFDIQCVGFSHNMIRGAAGGALYGAELLCVSPYFKKKG
jgi:aspartate-semialdehyde dehydrogenase